MEQQIVDALGIIADHIVNSGKIAIGEGWQGALKAFSGKKIHIECDITIPDLTK